MQYLTLLVLFIGYYSYAQTEFQYENLGKEVNSPYNEVNPLISPDGRTLYFSRKDHPQNTYGPVNTSDIWYSRLDSSGTWSAAQRLKPPFNKAYNNGLFGITPDGNTFVVQGSYKNGKYEGIGLSVIKKTRRGWSEPLTLEIEDYEKLNKGYFSGAFLCNDGNTILLYFSEKKQDKNPDLYVTFKKPDNTWTKPLNLGASINSPYLDAAPFLASDEKTLYFCSTRPGGFGDADIYKSRRLDDSWTNWSKPENLGPGINTANRETYYSLAASGDFAYIVSSPGEFGKSDIVKVKLSEKAKPDPVVLISGKVVNAITGTPLEADIIYENLANGKTAGTASSDPDNGNYQIVLPMGKTYGFSASAEGFLPVSQHLDLTNLAEYEEIKKDLLMMPIEVGQTLVLNNIFFETGSAELRSESHSELNRLAQILIKNKNLKIEIAGHTDNNGNDEANQKLSEDRAKAVMNYLARQGVEGSNMISKGYGETKPVTNNDTETGRSANRRVEFIILSQ